MSGGPIESAGSTASVGPQPAAQLIDEIRQVAVENPLGHPLAFSMVDMNFPLAPPPHLVDIYHSVYMGLNPGMYPNAFQHQAKIMPRDHAKSEGGSHVVPAWFSLKDPNHRTLIMMESETQAKDKLAECSETINRLAPKYGRQIVNDSATELKLKRDSTHDVPTIRAAGFETRVTGGHYDLIIFDDLISDDSVLTESRRNKAWAKFQERLNLRSGNDTVFLVLGTRKHPDDLYQKLIDSPAWHVTEEQAIKQWEIVENGEYDVICRDPETGEVGQYSADNRPFNHDIVRVEPHWDAEVLWPERYSLSDLIYNYLTGSLEDEQAQEEGLEGSRVWVRENQNVADALMGDILAEDMVHFVDGPPESRKLEDMPVYAGVDLALEPDAEKAAQNDDDYFSIAISYYDVKSATFYIDDVRRKRGMTMKEAVKWIRGHLDRYPTNQLYVESNQAQRWIVQSLIDEGVYAVEVNHNRQKEARITALSGRFENGKAVVMGNKLAPHWDSFLSEWVQFPTGDHDDRLDAVDVMMSARGEEDEEAKKTTRRPFV